ncbi:MAG: thymidine kinase [Chloroflexota bacterium]
MASTGEAERTDRNRNGKSVARAALRRALKLGQARLTVFTGPMKSGKSAVLISRLAQYEYAKLCIRVFYPALDARAATGEIGSRLGIQTPAYPVREPGEILAAIPEHCDVVAIDEAQLFADHEGLVRVVRQLIARGVVVLVAGLDLDFAERPFRAIATLCAMADRVEKLTAICGVCGSAFATRTQRLVNGRPASLADPAVVVEGSDDAVVYQARCHFCYTPPD